MMVKRLNEHDCKAHGYILDGLPRTALEAELLTQAGFEPQYIVHLQVPQSLL